MSKTYLLCLANSKKYGERCIAGIELVPCPNGQYFPKRTNGRPIWLRPVTDDEHGQVPISLVRDTAIGDILEMDCLHACPSGYQTENRYFEKKSFRQIRHAEFTAKHLCQLIEEDGRYIFGNASAFLTEDEIQHAGRSLILVRAEKARPYFCTPYHTKPRIKFLYKNNWYDFPVTDVNFIGQMQNAPELLAERTGVFLTVSLGVAFEGRYWKLAAGVLGW